VGRYKRLEYKFETYETLEDWGVGSAKRLQTSSGERVSKI
jgi:hypothetical protein